ncbi:hypothetical protein ACO0KY_14990 [Undibacterium sp. Dicai25W]|uniref:hypothetical protein n=1 Tax=Undibacterium sp. Dicai25W TaxID=3413034 RepID=UPI003BF0592D
MAQEQLIEYLRNKTKGKLLMTPEQLSDETGISTKQQSKLRQDKQFPIPHKNVGRLVFYSIYDVANFLLNGETTPIDKETEQALEQQAQTEPVKKRTRKTVNVVQDLSHIFMLRAFAKSLEQRATKMLQLAHSLLNYADKKELKDSFELKFAKKGTKQKVEKQ